MHAILKRTIQILFLVLAGAVPAHATACTNPTVGAFTCVQAFKATNNGTSVTPASATVTAGNIIYVILNSTSTTSVLSITGCGGQVAGGWVIPDSGTTTGISAIHGYGIVTTTGSCAPAGSGTVSGNMAIAAVEISGSNNAIDGHKFILTGVINSGATITGPSVTTNSSGDLILGSFQDDGASSKVYTAGSGYTALASGSFGIFIEAISQTTAGVIAPTASYTNGTQHAAGTLAIKVSGGGPPPPPPPPVTNTVTVNYNSNLQTMDGWGGQDWIYGRNLTSAQADLFFSPTAGIGLSYVRSLFPFDSSTPDSVTLQAALARGAKIWMEFESPPCAIKHSFVELSEDCTTATGSNFGTQPLAFRDGAASSNGTCFTSSQSLTTSYTSFANTIKSYLQTVQTAAGGPVSIISIDNEPNLNSSSLGSCSWGSGANLRDFINTLVPILSAAGLTPQILMPQASNWFSSDFATSCLQDTNCNSRISIVAGHGYGYPFTPVTFNANGHHLWLSETGDQAGTYDGSLAEGLVWAQNINDWLTIAQVSAADWWELAFNHLASFVPNGGLTDEAFNPAKRFYFEGQWSKFVRPGYICITDTGTPPSGVSVTAFKSASQVVIVAVNTSTAGQAITFNYNGFNTNTATPYITNANLNIAQQPPLTVSGNSFTTTLTAQSVTTFVANQAAAGALLSSGIIDPARAKDWTKAGIPGGIPSANWTQCGSTIAAGSSAATITAALTSCAGKSQFVLLGPGTFSLTAGPTFNSTGHVALRGSGANSTFLNISSPASGCNGRSAFICNVGGDGTFRGQAQSAQVVHNWTAGFSQGSTQITLDSVSGIVPNQSILLLNQCDTGFSGATCATGSATDNGGYFECALPFVSAGIGCTPATEGSDGASWRGTASNVNPAWQQEWAQAIAISGNVVTLSKPLDHPNWALSQSPQVVVIQPVIQVGVENLSIVGPGTALVDGVYFQNAYQCWVSGVTVKNDGNKGVELLDGVNCQIQNNYFFGNPQNYGDNAGVGIQGGNNLVQNNICHKRSLCVLKDGPSEGDVFAYNYDPAGFVSPTFTGMKYAYDTHSAGDNFDLLEGNVWPSTLDDNDHGTHLNQTRYRNFQSGWQSCVNGMCSNPVNTFVWAQALPAGGRYSASIANVLGTPSFSTIYQDATLFGSGEIYAIGAGNGSLPTDPKVQSTMLKWGDYNTVTALSLFCSSGHTNFASCPNGSEVPTGAPTYPNPVPTIGDTVAGQVGFPPSFYSSSKPSFFGSLAWPGIGPDVSSGNVSQCTGTLGTTSQAGLPATNANQCGSGAVSAAWGGHVNANPAMHCYLDILSGLPDGSGPAIAFDPVACYAPGGGGGPPPAATLTVSCPLSPCQSINFGTVVIGAANPVVLQHKSIACSAAATCAVTFGSNLTSGSTIIAAGHDGFGTGLSLTFTDGTNTYTQATFGGNAFCNLAGDKDTTGVSVAPNTSNSALTVTMADGGHSSSKRVTITEVSNLGAVDQTACNNQASATSFTSGLTAATAQANEFLHGFVDDAGAGETLTAGTNYTIQEVLTNAGSQRSANETQNVTVAGTYAATFTSSVADEAATTLVTFLSNGSGGSSSQLVSLQNTGNATLTGLTKVLSDTADFNFSSDTCGTQLVANASCSFLVNFAPVSAATFTPTLTLTSNANNSPTVVTISGTGSANSPCNIVPIPASLSFGNQQTLIPSTVQQIILTNNSTTNSCTTVSVAMQTGTHFSQTNNCPATLGVGHSCAVNVTFTPTTSGAKTDNVVIGSNVPSVNVLTIGTGLSPGAGVAGLATPGGQTVTTHP